MTKMTNRQRIDARIKEELEKNEPKALKSRKFFGRKRNYKDLMTGLVFNSCDNYADNKRTFQTAFNAVCRGECKDMFEAHKKFVA